MDFFDKLGKKASETYKVTAEKTGKIAKETKLKFKINDLRSSVIDMYEEIGKKVYERHEEGKKSVNFEKDLADEIKKLEEITSEIAKLNEECLALKDKRKCPECYFEVEKEANFCSNCGIHLEKEESIEAELVEEEPEEDEAEKQEEHKEENKEEKADKNVEHKESKKSKDKKAKEDLQKTVEVESAVKEDKKQDKKKEEDK